MTETLLKNTSSAKIVSARIPMVDYIEFLKQATNDNLSITDFLIMKLYQEDKVKELTKSLSDKESRIKDYFGVSSDRSASSTIHDSKYRNRSTTNRNREFIALSEALRLKSLISKTEDFPTHRKINESKRRIIIINTPTELKGGRNISNL